MSKKKELMVSDEWWDLVFDISKCKCPIAPNPPIHNGKMSCSCSWEDRIPPRRNRIFERPKDP